MNIDYGQDVRQWRWRRALKRWLGLIAIAAFVATCLWGTTRSTWVNYRSGVLRNGIYVFNIPIFRKERPLYESKRPTHDDGGWRLMVRSGVFGQGKHETIETVIVNELRMALEEIAIASASLSPQRSNELIEAAWLAAASQDVKSLQAIKAAASTSASTTKYWY